MNVTAIIIIVVVVVVIIILGIILNSGTDSNSGASSGTNSGTSNTNNSASSGTSNANSGSSNNNTTVIPPEEVITYCPADADWPQTNIGETVELSCPSGMIGKRVRLCREDGSWYDISDMSGCTEQSNEIITPDNTDSIVTPDNTDSTVSTPDNIDVPVTQYCSAVVVNNPDLTQGKVSISFNVAYRFYYKNCAADKTNAKESEVINRTITGSYRFTFIADVNKIPDEYKRVKASIPATVFNSIQDRVNEANNTDCKLSATDFTYDYPSELKVFKNDEYLIIISNTIYDIETYAYDYPYNYINNSIATIQSKHQQNIIPLNNELYKVWTAVADNASDAACKKSKLSYVWGSKIGDLYTNKYINLAIVLNVLLRSTEASLYAVNDCSAIFQYKRGSTINILMSQEKYCRGIYQLADVKSAFSNICGAVNTWNGKGWRYIIDFDADYQTKPNVYNIASGKTVYIFNDGKQLVKYDDVANHRAGVYVPTVECGLSMINE